MAPKENQRGRAKAKAKSRCSPQPASRAKAAAQELESVSLQDLAKKEKKDKKEKKEKKEKEEKKEKKVKEEKDDKKAKKDKKGERELLQEVKKELQQEAELASRSSKRSSHAASSGQQLSNSTAPQSKARKLIEVIEVPATPIDRAPAHSRSAAPRTPPNGAIPATPRTVAGVPGTPRATASATIPGTPRATASASASAAIPGTPRASASAAIPGTPRGAPATPGLRQQLPGTPAFMVPRTPAWQRGGMSTPRNGMSTPRQGMSSGPNWAKRADYNDEKIKNLNLTQEDKDKVSRTLKRYCEDVGNQEPFELTDQRNFQHYATFVAHRFLWKSPEGAWKQLQFTYQRPEPYKYFVYKGKEPPPREVAPEPKRLRVEEPAPDAAESGRAAPGTPRSHPSTPEDARRSTSAAPQKLPVTPEEARKKAKEEQDAIEKDLQAKQELIQKVAAAAAAQAAAAMAAQFGFTVNPIGLPGTPGAMRVPGTPGGTVAPGTPSQVPATFAADASAANAHMTFTVPGTPSRISLNLSNLQGTPAMTLPGTPGRIPGTPTSRAPQTAVPGAPGRLPGTPTSRLAPAAPPALPGTPGGSRIPGTPTARATASAAAAASVQLLPGTPGRIPGTPTSRAAASAAAAAPVQVLPGTPGRIPGTPSRSHSAPARPSTPAAQGLPSELQRLPGTPSRAPSTAAPPTSQMEPQRLPGTPSRAPSLSALPLNSAQSMEPQRLPGTPSRAKWSAATTPGATSKAPSTAPPPSRPAPRPSAVPQAAVAPSTSEGSQLWEELLDWYKKAGKKPEDFPTKDTYYDDGEWDIKGMCEDINIAKRDALKALNKREEARAQARQILAPPVSGAPPLTPAVCSAQPRTPAAQPMTPAAQPMMAGMTPAVSSAQPRTPAAQPMTPAAQPMMAGMTPADPIDFNKNYFVLKDGAYFCTLCNLYATEGHIMAEKHKRNVAWQESSQEASDPEYSREYFELRQDDSGEGWYCTLCNQWADEWHLKGKKHLKNRQYWEDEHPQQATQTAATSSANPSARPAAVVEARTSRRSTDASEESIIQRLEALTRD